LKFRLCGKNRTSDTAHKRIAIVGTAGVGDAHILALARPSLGRLKAVVMADLALEINLELGIKIFPESAKKILSKFFTI
jgi:tRNA A37 threonylcarbamoyladenosine dehydratase